MFGTRRLAKRSIIGTRVCAPWTDGRFYPGVIQSIQSWPNGEDAYTVNFDDGYTRTFTERDLIGPGFQPITAAKLKFGQKVFLTHNGREMSGQVVKHDAEAGDVVITVKNNSVDDMELMRRLDEVRLMESRKSARLQDQDTDYSRLADVHQQEAKRRAVSHVIDVPSPTTVSTKHRRHRKNSSSPDPEGDSPKKASGPDSQSDEMLPEDMDDDRIRDGDVMDEHAAAMVLTSLSCSPVSPGGFAASDKGGSSPFPGSSIGSSGVWSANPSPSQSGLSQSAPVSTIFSGAVDEGIELDDTVAYFASDDSTSRKRRASTRTVFKCTWPGCGKIQNTVTAIERHIRQLHLGPKEGASDDSDLSDHEEEFYYTEIEVSVETVTQTFADMYTSSPPPQSFMEDAARPPPDHDYQKKDHRSTPLNIPPTSTWEKEQSQPHGASYPSTQPTPIHQLSRSQSWQIPSYSTVRVTKAQERLHQHQAQSPKTHHFLSSSPKNSPMHKKSRSDIKKCRKVYGMENRDMWCTQCKWKKACSRFMD